MFKRRPTISSETLAKLAQVFLDECLNTTYEHDRLMTVSKQFPLSEIELIRLSVELRFLMASIFFLTGQSAIASKGAKQDQVEHYVSIFRERFCSRGLLQMGERKSLEADSQNLPYSFIFLSDDYNILANIFSLKIDFYAPLLSIIWSKDSANKLVALHRIADYILVNAVDRDLSVDAAPTFRYGFNPHIANWTVSATEFSCEVLDSFL